MIAAEASKRPCHWEREDHEEASKDVRYVVGRPSGFDGSLLDGRLHVGKLFFVVAADRFWNVRSRIQKFFFACVWLCWRFGLARIFQSVLHYHPFQNVLFFSGCSGGLFSGGLLSGAGAGGAAGGGAADFSAWHFGQPTT